MEAKFSERHMRHANFLSKFHFHVLHMDGKKNVVTDTLSRQSQVPTVSCLIMNLMLWRSNMLLMKSFAGFIIFWSIESTMIIILWKRKTYLCIVNYASFAHSKWCWPRDMLHRTLDIEGWRQRLSVWNLSFIDLLCKRMPTFFLESTSYVRRSSMTCTSCLAWYNLGEY